MKFDNPKVTIDLEEYQHLKDKVAGMDSDQYVVAAKKVVAALLNTRNDIHSVNEYLSKEGIIFSIATSPYNSSRYGIHYDQISIALIDKTE